MVTEGRCICSKAIFADSGRGSRGCSKTNSSYLGILLTFSVKKMFFNAQTPSCRHLLYTTEMTLEISSLLKRNYRSKSGWNLHGPVSDQGRQEISGMVSYPRRFIVL